MFRLNKFLYCALFLVLISWIFQISMGSFAYLSWPYDIDATDGEFLNIVQRIYRRLPIYLDWNKGKVLPIYTPIYYFILSLGKLISVDTLIFGRTFNFLTYLTSIYLVLAILLKTLSKKNNQIAILFSLLGAFFYIKCADLYPWEVINIRPDSTLLFITLLAIYVYITLPFQVFVLSILSLLAIWTKQTGIVLAAGIMFSLYLQNRKAFYSYCLYSFF